MWKWISLVIGAVLIFAGVMVDDSSGASQATASPRPAAPAQVDVDTPDDSLLRWPLPLGAEKYAAIDGKRMHRDVVAQALISRRYRDRVHPKFKGDEGRLPHRAREAARGLRPLLRAPADESPDVGSSIEHLPAGLLEAHIRGSSQDGAGEDDKVSTTVYTHMCRS